MSTEMHQLGRDADTAHLASMAWAPFGRPGIGSSKVAGSTLTELDVDDTGVIDLWAAVREVFRVRGLEPEIGPDAIDPDAIGPKKTATSVAATMASLLAGDDRGDSEAWRFG